MNLHKLSKRHSIHSMQPQQLPLQQQQQIAQSNASGSGPTTTSGRTLPEELRAALLAAEGSIGGTGSASNGAGSKQQSQQQPRKKGKFKLKERSSSSVRERFVNDPAYTEDVRHLALPMRRNSGPDNVPGGVGSSSGSRKFYTMPKKKSHSVGKDYSGAGAGAGAGVSIISQRDQFYRLDAEQMRRGLMGVTGAGGQEDQSYLQVKVRRKKYNYHNSSEMLRFGGEESSSSGDLKKGGGSGSADRRGRSLDRRGDKLDSRWFEKERRDEGVGGIGPEETRGRNRNLMKRQNAAEDGSSAAAQQAMDELVEVDEASKDSKSKFQIGKRFLKGEIGIKSFNYYLLKEGLKSSKKNLLKQRSAPVEAGRGAVGLSKSEENIYEEIYFEEKTDDPNDEKIQFIDCELCVQQCDNDNCEVCHSNVSKHTLQQHHNHHQQHMHQEHKQNIYEKLKNKPGQHPGGGASAVGPQYKAVKSLDMDELNNLYYSSSSTYGSAGAGNVLQYQSYNPKNPNVFKIETTPVAFSCDYNPIQQIYNKPQQQQYGVTLPPGAQMMASVSGPQQQQRHIYQQPQKLVSSGSDYYQEVNRKKSSSSSDSLHARMQRELYQQANLYYYQRDVEAQKADPAARDPSQNIYKTSSNASILSAVSAKSENSLKHPRTGNMSDSSLGDSLFSYPANRRYFGSSESCRFASECRRCSLDVDKCSFSDTCRYDCRNCDCSSSYFSSDFDDTGTRRKINSLRQSTGTNADNYSVPAYAEDFMKHVSNVKRNQLGGQQQPQQQPKQTSSGKIYETPTTYAGLSKKIHEHTYETLKSNPYGMTGTVSGHSLKALYKYDENTKQSISHSHELLLSPSRSKMPLEGRNSLGTTIGGSRYGPQSSNTLPASIRARSTEFNQSLIHTGGTLPKTFTTPLPDPPQQQPRTTLTKLNHDYAEIAALPAKPAQTAVQTNQPVAAPSAGKRTSVKYTAPQPPKPASNNPSQRRQAPPIPSNPPLSSSTEPKSINQPAAAAEQRDKSLPRKERAEFERSKRGAAAAVAATIQDVGPPKTAPNNGVTAKNKTQQPMPTTSQQQQSKIKESRKKSVQSRPLPAPPTTSGQVVAPPQSSQQLRQHHRQQQQHHIGDDADDEDGNFTDDEDDDEVFLSDKKSRRKLPPPNPSPRGEPQSTTTTTTTPSTTTPTGSECTPAKTLPTNNLAAVVPPSSSSSTMVAAALGGPSKQQQVQSKQREHQPEPGLEAAEIAKAANESESVRTPAPPNESDVDATATDDGRVSSGAGLVVGDGSPVETIGEPSTRIKTKSPEGALSSDLAVAGETALALLVPSSSGCSVAIAAATGSSSSNRSNPEQQPLSVNSSPAKSGTAVKGPTTERLEGSARDQHQQDQPLEQGDAPTVVGDAAGGHGSDTAAATSTAQTAPKLITASDECDIIDFPLPEIPVKQDPTSSDASFITATDNDTTGTEEKETGAGATATTRSSAKRKGGAGAGGGGHSSSSEQLNQEQTMHYRQSSTNNEKPTYLFGENLKKNEIFLNKSGWVQVSQPPPFGGPGGERSVRAKSHQPELVGGGKVSRKYLEYDENRYGKGSKLEDLINRNEARRHQVQKVQRQDNVTVLKIDPQLPAGGRPACLPIKRNLADNSPPPVTPILSPPPAFQDSKYKTRLSEIKPGTRIFLSVVDNENRNPKGMVFSRSFEYDNRRYSGSATSAAQGQAPKQSYMEAFSKSFDFETNLATPMPKTTDQPFVRRNKSPTFSTLTGISPNYLTKKEKTTGNALITKDNSPIFPKSIPGSSVTSSGYESLKRFGPDSKNKSLDSQLSAGGTSLVTGVTGHRSRRSQFSTKANSTPGLPTYGYRSDSVGGNARLNSCDSGARSDYSNDGLDDEEEEPELSDDQSSSLALSYKSSTSYMNQMKGRSLFGSSGSGNTLTAHSALKPQRSLTPERLFDNDEYGSMRNLKKQRSLTPEKQRSRTPDDRSKPRKGDMNSSQSSLVSRQSSGSRSSTLERRYEEAYNMRTSSRSSSSSSYSGDEAHAYRRSQIRAAGLRLGNVAGDYKIRRSRSLQLSERSPSRQQMVPGALLQQQQQQQQQQPQQQPHKVVVRLGNVPKERPLYAVTTGGRKLLTHDSMKGGFRVSPNSTLDRLRRETAMAHTIVDVDKSKSFDNNNYGVYEYDFDKSKSFDENFGLDAEKRVYASTEGRSYSHDRVFSSTGTSSSNEYSQSSTSRNKSPQQSYGARLYEHDLQFEMGRNALSRSPIMNYGQRRPMSRERSPVPGASKPALLGSYQKPSDLYLMRNLTPDSEFDDRTTPDFCDEPPKAATTTSSFKEAELVKKFLYATKNKQMQREARNAVVPPAGTPSSGSCCTASSCDFWPHCGLQTPSSSHQLSSLAVGGHNNQLIKSGSENCLNRRISGGVVAKGSGGVGNVGTVIGTSSAGGLVQVKANSYGGVGHHPLKKQKNVDIHDRDLPAVVGGGGSNNGGMPRYYYGGGGQLSTAAIVKANSITFLGDHEMPITRDRGGIGQPGVVQRQSSDSAAQQRSSNYGAIPASEPKHRRTSHGSASGGGNGGGGSSNSSVKSNGSSYRMNRSPNSGRGGNLPGGASEKSSSGREGRDRKTSGSSSGGGSGKPSSVSSVVVVVGSGSGGAGGSSSTSVIPPSTTARLGGSIKRKYEMKLKSRSLPKSFMRYSNLDSEDLELTAIFSANSPLQLRAVSSPALTEPTPPPVQDPPPVPVPVPLPGCRQLDNEDAPHSPEVEVTTAATVAPSSHEHHSKASTLGRVEAVAAAGQGCSYPQQGEFGLFCDVIFIS
ncbi:uncharacterized protein LOC129751004 isoform X2 [Uranotaenia lowii]|uniref:uncharacterized protein LOC129751004 isoform X2 n=1 Tax=Uranotaenia lowii TaxID=190385 RepID=UPI00247838B3|nr:uncharacterized protein LOC129751004 isoform X2 [Uranotaenia lowii]